MKSNLRPATIAVHIHIHIISYPYSIRPIAIYTGSLPAVCGLVKLTIAISLYSLLEIRFVHWASGWSCKTGNSYHASQLLVGIAGCCRIFQGIVWYSMVLHGTVKCCIVLLSIAWYRLVTANTPITSQLLGPQPRSASYNRGGKSQKTDRQNKPRQIES